MLTFTTRSKESMMIPLAIIPGPKKPKYLMSFLRPIVEEINALSNKGFVVQKNGQTIHQSKVFLLGMTGDIPGIADLMNHRGHMSTYGCRLCHVAGCRPQGTNRGLYFLNPGAMRSKEELVDGNPVNIFKRSVN